MKIREVSCKTALSPSKLPGLEYSLNPYRGCQHNCAYCYVPNVLKINRDRWGSFVDVKTNIPLVLSKEIRNKKPGVVGISTITDPYQPIEKKYKLTQYCLQELLKHDFPICIQSKSALVLRDADLLSRFSNAEVMMSISTLNENERKLLEPHSSSIKERLNVLKQYSEIGVETSVFFGPILPTVTVENIPEVINTFIEHGATRIWIDSLNIKPGVLENIKKNVSHNKNMCNLFSKNIFKNKEYYAPLREEIFRIARRKNLEIIDAF
jgi:DNA repair photolyase